MARRINIKTMNIEALSNYNVASLEIIALTQEKEALLKPLKEEKASILAQRTEALKEDGATLDDVLRRFSIDEVEAKIQAVNFKFAEPLRSATKEQNKVLKAVNPNFYFAYALSMASKDTMFNAYGDYTYTKSNGESVTVKVDKDSTFLKCIKAVYSQLGATGLEDAKALEKVANFHAKRIGGLNFNKKSQENELKKKPSLSNALIRDVINYLLERGFIVVNDDGTITKAQAQAQEEAQAQA